MNNYSMIIAIESEMIRALWGAPLELNMYVDAIYMTISNQFYLRRSS